MNNKNSKYYLSPISFNKWKDGYLLSNLKKDFIHLDRLTFDRLVSGTLQSCDPHYKQLKDDAFLLETISLQNLIDGYRSSNEYLFESTSLHIFVLTLSCNLSCIYCHAECKEDSNKKSMSKKTAKAFVDFALKSPSKNIGFEFQGGEPLFNFDTIKAIVDYSELRSKELNKKISYSIVTNLQLMSDEILHYLVTNNVTICSSLDGPESLHNNNRPLKGGSGSYQRCTYWIKKVNELYKRKQMNKSLSCIPTITKFSLKEPEKIIDTYIELGLSNIKIRLLYPYGKAKRNCKRQFNPTYLSGGAILSILTFCGSSLR